MKTLSAFPAEAPGAGDAAAAAPGRPVLVWDAPVRLVHWLLVLCFAGAWLTADGERWRLLHVTLGYTMAGLVVFRLAWGLVGSRHARFSSFVRAPAAALRYLKSLAGPRPDHHVGHNPAGALAIVGLLALALVVTASGFVLYQDWVGETFEELHEGAANAMLALIGLHVLGVVVGSWRHRESLLKPMLTGRKAGAAADALPSAHRGVAALVLAAVLGFWWLQWQDAPSGPGPAAPVAASAGAGGQHDDEGGDDRRRGDKHGDDD